MRDKLFGSIAKHPAWVILIFLALAIFTAAGAQKLVFKSDYRVFLDDDNPHLIAYESMQKIYNRSDNIAFIVAPRDGKVFTEEHLAALKKLTKQSWQIPYSTRVDSLSNFQNTYAVEDDLIVEDLVPDTNRLSATDIDSIKRTALNEPLLVDKIISEEGHVSVVNIAIKLPGIDPAAETPEVVAKVRAIKEQFLAENPDTDVYLSGMAMLNSAFAEAAMNDGSTLVPLMFLTVIIVIGLLLRTISGTFATVLVIIMSIVSAMGLAGWLGFYLTGPSSSAPTIILTLAVADCIHILTTMFYEMRQGADKRTAIAKSLQINLQPIFLTSLTTAVGFLSMNFSEFPPLRDLGNIVAMGGIFAFIFSMTIFPALLTLLPIKVKPQKNANNDKMLTLAKFVVNKRKILLPLVSAVIIAFTVFIPNNVLNDDFVKYFDESVPFRASTDFMQENLSGMTVLDMSVKTGVANGINNPEYLNAVSNFSDWLREQPETDHVNTITDTLKRLNKNMHGDAPEWYRLPATQEMAAQYLLLYEMSLPYGLDLNSQLNVEKSSTKLVGTFKNLTSAELIELGERIDHWFAQHAPEYELDIASPNFMFAHMSQKSNSSMLAGSFAALFIISIILGLALKSWRFGAISLLPNLIPAAVAFGIWGLIDGQVSGSIAMVTGMTLGIVVDDTVHFLSKYLHARRNQNANPAAAVQYAFGNVGNALLITTVVLVAGFTILAQSSFSMNGDMGLMTAITIFIALVVDFLFLPPLLIALDKADIRKSSTEDNASKMSLPESNTTTKLSAT
jgi:uncharacterized protein